MIQGINGWFFPAQQASQPGSSLVSDTLITIVLGALALAGANASKKSSPQLASALYCVPVGLCLIWLFRRCCSDSFFGNTSPIQTPTAIRPAPVYRAPPAALYQAPVYQAPPAAVYQAPVYQAPPAPIYQAPVYRAAPAPVYQAPVVQVQQPAVRAPVYIAPQPQPHPQTQTVYSHAQPRVTPVVQPLPAQPARSFPLVQPAPAQPGSGFPLVQHAPAQPMGMARAQPAPISAAPVSNHPGNQRIIFPAAPNR